MDERRETQRNPIELKVEYKRLNSFFYDYTRNISKGGTFIKTERPLPLGTEFLFSLSLPGNEGPIQLLGRVKWITSTEEATQEQPAGMGISFVFDNDKQRQDIQTHVERLMVNELGETISHQLLHPKGSSLLTSSSCSHAALAQLQESM